MKYKKWSNPWKNITRATPHVTEKQMLNVYLGLSLRKKYYVGGRRPARCMLLPVWYLRNSWLYSKEIHEQNAVVLVGVVVSAVVVVVGWK